MNAGAIAGVAAAAVAVVLLAALALHRCRAGRKLRGASPAGEGDAEAEAVGGGRRRNADKGKSPRALPMPPPRSPSDPMSLDNLVTMLDAMPLGGYKHANSSAPGGHYMSDDSASSSRATSEYLQTQPLTPGLAAAEDTYVGRADGGWCAPVPGRLDEACFGGCPLGGRAAGWPANTHVVSTTRNPARTHARTQARFTRAHCYASCARAPTAVGHGAAGTRWACPRTGGRRASR